MLITDQGNDRVIEVNRSKKAVRQYGTTGVIGAHFDQLSNPNSAELLENGHILIADENNNRVIEVTRAKQIVWQYPDPLDTSKINGASFASRLDNGNTLILALIALAAVILPSAASAANTRKFHVGAVTVSQSTGNIEPVARADADVTATDDGVNLTISGTGTGFVPGLSYLSFIYDTDSTAEGSATCLPSTPNPFTPPVMFVAYWLPTNASHRTLIVVKTGPSYTSLVSIGTISIRYDSTPAVSPLIGQTPLRFFAKL